MAAAKKPVMDVSKPGETPADATSRPIISGHAVLKDPMVNATDAETEAPIDALAESDESPKEVAAPSVAHKVIKPLEPGVDAADSDKKEEPKDEKKPESEVSDGAVVDAVLDQVTDKKKQEAVDAEEQKRRELVDKLVEEKKYFVPIGETKARKTSKILLIFIAALLPVLVGLVLAIDADIIKTNITLPFDLIK